MYDKRTAELDRTVFFLDILFTGIAFLVSFALSKVFYLEESVGFSSHVSLLPLQLALIVSFLSYFGAYQSPKDCDFGRYSWAVFRAISLSFGVFLSLLFFLEIQYVSRLVVMTFAGIDLLFVLLIRFVVRRYFLHSVVQAENGLRVFIIGTGERALELTEKLREQAEWGLDVVGYLDPDPERVGRKIGNSEVIGTIEDIHQCLKNHVVDEVIIAIPRSLLNDAEPIAWACMEEGIKLRFMADVFNLDMVNISLTVVGDLPLLTMEPVAQDESKLFLKRLFDIIVVTISMPIVLPILAFTALAVKLDSPGPAIFVQQRVGLRKHLFSMFKFRSMYIDAEEKLKEIEHLNEADGPIFKMKNDPRVTRVGKFIRKASLDELPQLFNVLRGEMSLVGPRPMSIRDVDLFNKGIQRKRFSVKPGLTCIWQISGRSNLTFDQWLELDLQYISTWSLWLDFMILFKTIPVVLFSKGAV